MKKQYWQIFTMAFCAAFLLCGCLSMEKEYPSDISLDELENKMESAMDPMGAFRNAKSFAQQQMLKVEGIFTDQLYQLDIKYCKPDLLKITTLEFNQPQSAVIFNQGTGWTVNYPKRTVDEVAGTKLKQLNVLHNLSNPTARFQQLFSNVTLTLCRIDGQEYYKIACSENGNLKNQLFIYVGKNDFLTSRMRATFQTDANSRTYHYSTEILEYELMDNVMIPKESRIVFDDQISYATVFYYKLNAIIQPQEFLPPIFPALTGKRQK